MLNKLRFVPVLLLTLLVNACVSNLVAEKASRFDQGVAAYDSGDYATAYRIWDELARENDLAAMRNVAQLLRQGKGVNKDIQRAFKLYMEAAEKGLVTAMANVGDMYYSGEGVEKNLQAAAAWYARAASAGLSLAQWKLAEMYEQGFGVQKDSERARALLERAARNGYAPAQAKLKAMGVTLTTDDKPVPDKDAAKDSVSPSGNAAGTPTSISGAAQPRMLPGDPIATDVVSKLAQTELTAVYAGIAAYSSGDLKNAFGIWHAAATRGNSEAQLRVGLLYERGEGTSQDNIEAYRWLRHSAASGHSRGISELARVSQRLAPAERAIAESLVREPISKAKKPN